MIKNTLITAIVSTFLVSACTIPGSAPAPDGATAGDTTAESQQTDQANPEQDAEATKCQNDFYPIDSSAKHKYKVTGDVPGEYVLSQDSPVDGTFKESRVFGSGLEVKINWICTEDGLRTAQFNNTADFMKGKGNVETLESSGITLPKEWSVGKTWEADYKIKANLSVGRASGSAAGTVNISNKIVSMDDKIEVRGEEVEAAKVESVLKMNLSMRGRRIPSPDVKMTNWYTKDVGLVKQSASAQFGKTGIEYLGKE